MLYQRRIVPAAATLAVTVLAACGGGGSTASPTPATLPAPVVTGSATLYTFVVDTAPDSIAGNGITSFGNTWHIARPSGAVAATPTPIPAGPY